MRLLLLTFCCLFSSIVWAINILPPTVQPERQTTKQPPVTVPNAPTDLLTITQTPPTAHPSSQTVYFTFSGVVFEGAFTLPEKDLHALYQDDIGKQINLVELYAIADRVENAYVSQGYILTRVMVPAQELGHGEKLKLLIIEGYIDEIDIETDDASLKSFLTNMAKPILASQPLRIQDLESALLKMNDLPGITVKSVLSPSEKNQGASRLIIEVSEQKYAGEAHVDNRGTVYTGPTEYLAEVTFNNPLGYISQTTLVGTMADPMHEMSAASLTHIKPFGEYGTFYEVVMNYSQVNPGDSLSVLDVNGYSGSLELLMQQPLIRQRNYNLSAYMEYNVLSSKTNSLDQLLYLDRIESLRAGLIGDMVDAWRGTNLVTAEFSQGVNLFTGQNKPHLERSRFFGTKDYTKVHASVSRLQGLPGNFAVYLTGQGQYSANPLLAAEEYGVGGEDYGLAYDYFEISGDSGYSWRGELRRSFFPNTWGLDFFQPYISFDGGQIFFKEEAFQQSLSSLGGGFRFDFTQFFIGQLEVAKPLTKEVAATQSNDARGFFYFTAQF